SAPERTRNALDLLPAALHAATRLAASQPANDVLGPATVVPTSVEARPESRNVIPDEVVLVLDWRVLPGATLEGLVEDVRRALEEALPAGTSADAWEVRAASEHQVTYTGLAEDKNLFTPGFLMEPDDPLVLAAARAVGRREGAGDAAVRPWTFATDGGWSCGVHGIATIGFAPGEERFAHTNRERLDLAEARWAFERYPVLIDALHAYLAGAA
ncbi:MAG: hypothetical protein D6701_14170, partial [Gemmatimonadetes bacterium]